MSEPTDASAFLESERLYLRALRESDADGPYLSWLNDAEVCRGNGHHVFPYTATAAREYIRLAGESRRDLILAVVLRQDDRHIGNIALTGMVPWLQAAEFAILMGDKREWGRGYGLEAGRLLLKHGFDTLNLHRIGCGTFATNNGMRKLALSLGMKEEGVRRHAAWKDGRWLDVVEYGILREEFELQ